MIATRRQEQGSRVAPDRLGKTEGAVIERFAFGEIADVQVDMTHRRILRDATPRLFQARSNHAVDVQRIGRHHKFTVPMLPCRARSIGVDLDTQPVGVPEYKASLTR